MNWPRCRRCSTRRSLPGRSAWGPRPSRTTTAMAAFRCRRAWPATTSFRALARVMARHGHGVTMATCGQRSTIPFMEELAELSGRPVIYCPLLDYPTRPEHAPAISSACADARTRGHAVYAQASCQPLNMNFGLLNAYMLQTIAPWPKHGDAAHHRALFTDPAFRAAFKTSLATPVEGGRIFNGTWHLMEVARVADPEPNWKAAPIEEIARERGVDPVDARSISAWPTTSRRPSIVRLLNVDEARRRPDRRRRQHHQPVRRRRASHAVLRCGLRHAPAGPLGARARPFQPAARYPQADQRSGPHLRHRRPRPHRGRRLGGPHAVRSKDDPCQQDPARRRPARAGANRLIRSAPASRAAWVNGVQCLRRPGLRQGEAAGPGAAPLQLCQGRRWRCRSHMAASSFQPRGDGALSAPESGPCAEAESSGSSRICGKESRGSGLLGDDVRRASSAMGSSASTWPPLLCSLSRRSVAISHEMIALDSSSSAFCCRSSSMARLWAQRKTRCATSMGSLSSTRRRRSDRDRVPVAARLLENFALLRIALAPRACCALTICRAYLRRRLGVVPAARGHHPANSNT